MVTKGVGCHRPNCQVHLHLHCFKNVRTRRGTCPSCSIDWPRNADDQPLIPIGENAARDGDERTRRVETKSDEESDEEEMDQSQDQSQSQPSQSKSSQKGKKKKATDMDVDEEEVDDEEEEEVVPQRSSRRRSTRRQ